MMTIAYDSPDDAYLGVEQGKTVKLMMPKQPMIGPMSKMGLNCTGWQLTDPAAVYTDFSIAAEERVVTLGHGKHERTRSITEYSVVAGASSGAEGLVGFSNQCTETDDAGNETVTTDSVTVKIVVNE